MDEGVPLLGWVRSDATRRGRRGYIARRAVAVGALPPPGVDGLEDEAGRKPTSKPLSVSPCLRALRVNRPEAG